MQKTKVNFLSLFLSFTVVLAIFSAGFVPNKVKAVEREGYWLLVGNPTETNNLKTTPYARGNWMVQKESATITKDTYTYHRESSFSSNGFFGVENKTSQTDATYKYTPLPEKINQNEVVTIQASGEQTTVGDEPLFVTTFSMLGHNVDAGGNVDYMNAPWFTYSSGIVIEGTNKKTASFAFTAPEYNETSIRQIKIQINVGVIYYEYTYMFQEPSQDSGARFSSISGQIEVLQPGETEWEDARMDTVLMVKAHIRTANDYSSTCIISFKDMSTFRLNPGTEIEIAELKEDSSKIKLVLGKLWANIKKMTRDGKMEISTTQAVAGIKGTIFAVTATKDTTTLDVLQGKVEFTCISSMQKVMVEANNSASAQNVMMAVVKLDVKKDKADWDKIKGATSSGSKFSLLVVFIIFFFVVLIIAFIYFFIIRKKKRNI